MLFPAYKVSSSNSINEVAQSIGVDIDTLQDCFTCIIAKNEHLKGEIVKYIKIDGIYFIVYHLDGEISLWYSDDNWESSTIDDAEDIIDSVESGIGADFWAIFII
ncbi:hypothetical protein DL121_13380 [Salmonella enterica subsp. enterica]|nr:hypothetical protein [Salmonella enterica subsp. enterica]